MEEFNSFIGNIKNFDTLFQLAVGLNIAGVAVYQFSEVGKIIENFFSQTKRIVENRCNSIMEKIIIDMRTITTANIDLSSDDVNANEAIADLDREYSDIKNHISDNYLKDNLYPQIQEKCMPKHMAGICAICTLYAFIQLLFIAFVDLCNWCFVAFHLFAIGFIIPIIVFCIVKTFIITFLYYRIDALQYSLYERRKQKQQQKENSNLLVRLWLGIEIFILEQKMLRIQTKRHIDCDYPQEYEQNRIRNREKYERFRDKCGDFLSVKIGIILGLALSVLVCIVSCLCFTHFIEYFINKTESLQLIEIGSVVSAYIPCFIYSIVLAVFKRRKLSLINNFFKEPEKQLLESEKHTVELQGYLKISSHNVRSTISIEDSPEATV